MTKAPASVQQWVDMLPPVYQSAQGTDASLKRQRLLSKEPSQQSDASSHCSNLETVLELRRPDPEAVLIGLGFGPPKTITSASRIPARFLQPSELCSHIDVNKFLERENEIQINTNTFSSPTLHSVDQWSSKSNVH